MPYIGNDIQYGELNSQTFTGDGSTTAFTLTYTVSNVNSLLVTVADVIQEPTTAYTVSGTTLTFTSAPANSDTIHVRYLGRTLDVGTTAIVQDSDQDTKIQVEESADEDTIRFDTAGTERVTINSTSLTSNVNVSAPNLVTQNLIVNPEFRYDQESYSGTTGIGTSDDYIADQWEFQRGSGSETARWTASIEADGGVSGTRKWLKMLCTTAETSVATGDFHIVAQRLEAQAIRPTLLDSSGIGAHVVAYDIILHADGASSITFPATLSLFSQMFDGTARQYIGDVTITAADTWQRVYIAVPADATGTINNDNGAGMIVGVPLMVGATYQNTAGAWANRAPDFASSSSVNIADATNNYIGITAVKLEPGTVATPFVSEDYQEGLLRCKRFFRIIGNGLQGVARTTSVWYCGTTLDIPMRTDPAGSLIDTSISIISEQAGGNPVSSGSAFSSITNQFKSTGFMVGINGFGGALTAGDNYRTYSQADFLALSARY